MVFRLLLYVPCSGQNILHSSRRVNLCVLYGFQDKQRLFPYAALTDWFIGAFEKSRKTTINFVTSVCPSVPMEQLGWQWTHFHQILHLCIIRKFVDKIQVSSKSGKNNVTALYMKTDICASIIISRRILLIVRNFSDKK